MPQDQHWIDRLTSPIAPIWTLRRQRARVVSRLVQRHYEAAAIGRRTQGWNRSRGDVNATVGPGLALLRESARDLVRNNPYAQAAISTICDHAIGWGIVAKPKPANKAAAERWNEWAGSTACDADGRHDFYGLQKLVLASVAESGEVLVRRRFRLLEDGLPIPIQLQVIEPDFLDTSRDIAMTATGGRIVQGVEFNAIGKRTAYWLFKDHPGNASGLSSASVGVPAESVLHIFEGRRPGQVRGPSWFAPVLLRFKDFDEFEDATLMKQKIAACLAVITTDADGSTAALGTADDAQDPLVDSLEPGAILNVSPGRSVTVVDPPSVREYSDYVATTLRAIATGLGLTYEDLTGDYTNLPFSAARMSRLRHRARVDDWRWNLIIPQFCDPVWNWAMQAVQMDASGAEIRALATIPEAEWTAPKTPMIEPDKEGLAYQRLIRSGLMTLSEAIRELGYDPNDMLNELAGDFKKLDTLGLVLDCDPRRMTQAGQAQAVPPEEEAVEEGGDEIEDEEDEEDLKRWPYECET